MAAADTRITAANVLDRGIPISVEAEQYVLGSVLLDERVFPQVAGILDAADFALEKHRRIFQRMIDLQGRGERIDLLTLLHELEKRNQLESVDGAAYLASLTESLPRLANVESYARIVKDKSTMRLLIDTAQQITARCIEGGDEVQQILSYAESAILKVGDTQMRAGLAAPRKIIEEFPGGIQAFLDPSRRLRGLATPYHKLEEMTTGMHGGELIIVAARPAMGKTSFALNIAHHVATEQVDSPPQPVALFSLEMSKESLLTRMLCGDARVDSHRFRGGYLNRDERQRLNSSLKRLVNSKLYIDDSADTNVLDIAAKCRRLKAEEGLALVIIDYLQLMASKGRVENRVQEISQFSRGLKLLAKDLDVPIMALSQLSRAPEQRKGDFRPILSDLRESGSIEQDADVVMFIFREEVYRPDREDLHGVADLLLAKQRNGPTGKIKLAFLNKFAKFENLAEDIGAPEDDFNPVV